MIFPKGCAKLVRNFLTSPLNQNQGGSGGLFVIVRGGEYTLLSVHPWFKSKKVSLNFWIVKLVWGLTPRGVYVTPLVLPGGFLHFFSARLES